MSKKLKHYQALGELVVHALLALYSAMSQQGGFWTVKRRNELLVKFIKSKLKLSQFSVCKKDMKTMLSIGRSPVGNLEQRLWEVNKLNLEYGSTLSQADELYIMLTDIAEQHQFNSLLDNPEKTKVMDTLYMKQSDIEGSFNELNQQVKPLSMTVKTSRLKAFIDAVQAKGVYRVEIDHVDAQEVIHLLLHRTSEQKVTD